MKLSLLLAVPILSSLCIVSAEDFTHRIQSVDNLLTTEGPTINVLEQFEDLVREIQSDSQVNSALPNLYFKKALIALSLNKKQSAIDDFKSCLQIDPQMKPARKRLVDLYFEKGDFEAVHNTIDGFQQNFQEITAKVSQYGLSFEKAKDAFSQKDFGTCIDELEKNVLSITPNNIEAYQLHIQCIKQKVHFEENKDTLLDLFRNLIKDYSQLIQNQPMNLDTYDDASSYLLYTQGQFDKSWGIVKNCLRIDNDFKPCGKKSKFFHKFQDFFKIFEKYIIMDGFYYTVGDEFSTGQIDDSLIVSNDEFATVNKILFHEPLKVSKADKKALPTTITTNYEYLKYQYEAFVEKEGLAQKTIQFIDLLEKLSCESHVVANGGNSKSPECAHVKDDPQNPFLPLHLHQIDKLIKSKKFAEADNIMSNKLNKNLKQSKLFQDRYRFIEEYKQMEQIRQQEEQQRQWQQQQQQQQRQWQQQQQQQQQTQHQMSPKVDYYKVLDIAKDADEKTIKKAYRTQTLKFHPDKYKGDDLTPEEIEGKMQDINQAYEILSKPELREEYDRGASGGGHGGGFGGYQQHFDFGGFGGQGSDFFNRFMNQQGGGNGFKFQHGRG